MATAARGTGLDLAKSQARGKKYLAPTADAVLWGSSALAAPELTAVAYWYEKGGGKEYLAEKGQQVGKAIGTAQNWLDERKRRKNLIGIKQTDGMGFAKAGYDVGGSLKTLGIATAVVGLTEGKVYQHGNAARAARDYAYDAKGQAAYEHMKGVKNLEKAKKMDVYGWSPSNRYWEDTGRERAMKYIKLAHSRIDREEAAMARAEHWVSAGERELKLMQGWQKVSAVGAGIGAAATGYEMYKEIKKGNAQKRGAKLAPSSDRY